MEISQFRRIAGMESVHRHSDREVGGVHISEEDLAYLLVGKVDTAERERWEAHLVHCSRCTGRLRESYLFMEGLAKPDRWMVVWHRGVAVAASLFLCLGIGYLLLREERPARVSLEIPASATEGPWEGDWRGFDHQLRRIQENVLACAREPLTEKIRR
jgi:hypothetical protein